MIDAMKRRIDDLKQEYANGQEQLRTLDRRREDLQQTLIRILGAIQVLEEMIEEQAAGAGADPDAD